MLTLLGSLIGFLSSAFPAFLSLWKEKENKKYELSVLDKKIELQKLGHTQSLEVMDKKSQASATEALYQYDNKTSTVKWVDGLRSSVRPVITYSFFLIFTAVKIATLILVVREGASIADGITYLWDEDTKALFACVITFWFGQRAILRHKGLCDGRHT